MALEAGANDPEKTAGLSFASSTSSAPHGHHTGAHARERIRHFLHPNGKRIHVASDPVEAEHLRRRLNSVANGTTREDFDIYISGTPEHLEAVQRAQTHHEARRDALRAQHQEAWEQFADVQGELDVLSGELNRVTDHGVELDAHFDRFGYSAHIKSYDQDGGEHRSGTSTPRRSSDNGSERESGGDSGKTLVSLS